MAKHWLDVFFAALLGVLALPLMGLTALLVWLESGAPVMHRSVRVGRHGRSFYYFHFSTKVGAPPQKTRVGRLTGPGLLTYLEAYNQTPVAERIQPDLVYAQNQSAMLDIQLLFQTMILWLKMGHLKGKV